MYKKIILAHSYLADFVIWDRTLLEAKAIEELTDSNVRQVLNYLAASRLKLGLLVNSARIRLYTNVLFFESLV